jgi:hypothetical protein
MSLRDACADRKQLAGQRPAPPAERRLGFFRRLLGRTRTLDSHASRLRRKLNQSSDTAYVLNVWGVGYRLVAAA